MKCANFQYCGKPVTNENCIYEEVKNRLILGNTYYHSAQNLLSSRLLFKNIKIKVHKTIILPVFCTGVEFDISH
jgi:hypothetical protein